MNAHDLPTSLLLRQSGELSPEEEAALEDYLRKHPDAQRMAEEFTVLQHAERFASREVIPPVPETSMEAIRQATAPHSAGLVLVLAFLPFLLPSGRLPVLVDDLTTTVTEPATDVVALSNDLEDLELELTAWQDTTAWELLEVEEENYWAEQLLTFEESI